MVSLLDAMQSNFESGLSPHVETASANIRVAVRIRPLNYEEDIAGLKCVWKKGETLKAKVKKGGNEDGSQEFGEILELGDDGSVASKFRFDYICPASETTTDLYSHFVRGVVTQAMNGYHGNVLAHGQTGSGKTYSTLGTENEPGIVLLAFSDIFQYIRAHSERRFLLRMAYLEIYNDSVNCLLGDGRDLKPDLSATDGVMIPGLRYEFVRSPKDFVRLLLRGERNRKVGHTDLNTRSSRSHAILSVLIQSKLKDTGSRSREASSAKLREDLSVRSSVLNLVDLAGSENIGCIGTKRRQKECRHINRSLLGLSRVVAKLSQRSLRSRRHDHIPFRDCKLTRILQPGLSGNSNTIFIATLTPTEEAREESRSTLRFASFANRIQTRVTVNEKSDARSELRICRRMMHELKQELYRYKARARGSIDAEQRAQNLDKKNRELLALLKQQQECQQRLVKRIETLQRSLEMKAGRQEVDYANENGSDNVFSSSKDVHERTSEIAAAEMKKSVQARVARLRKQLDEAESSISSLVLGLSVHCAEERQNDIEQDGEEKSEIVPTPPSRSNSTPTSRLVSVPPVSTKLPQVSEEFMMTLFSKGMSVTKYCTGRLGCHECRLWIDRREWCIKWCTARVVQGALQGLMCKKMKLDDVIKIEVGNLQSQVFQKNWSDELNDARELAVTFVSHSRTLDVVFQDETLLHMLLKGLNMLLPDLEVRDDRTQRTPSPGHERIRRLPSMASATS